jgi:hypothetical protein
MAKILIPTLVILAVILIVYFAIKPEPVVTQPTPTETPTTRAPTPRAPEIDRGVPTQKAPEPITPTQGGIEAAKVFPSEVTFWVNEIRVPESTTYQEGLNFIPIKKSQLKTFAGSFGPYFEDPTQHLRVLLCSEFYKLQAAPACETVPIRYVDKYVTFARGYQFDEYIGGMAAKDYIAYYDVFVADTKVAHSNQAVIRTVND